ncbi:MAG: hypothetical protein ACP5TL_01245 [Candidatus Micrarchaeia archaeon]
MHKGFIAYIILLVIMIVLVYIYTGFRLPNLSQSSTTSTVPSNSIVSTTVATTTINYTPILNCSNFRLEEIAPNTTISAKCIWKGGTLGIWLAGGSDGATFSMSGINNITFYKNVSAPSQSLTFFTNSTLPSGTLNISLSTGYSANPSNYSIVVINTTTVPPRKAYNNVFNGAFSDGKYTGWNVTGKGFGILPFNMSYANQNNCYLGRPWSNYNGNYFATTYTCGLSVSPGNITSSTFIVNASNPFLNFKIISPINNQLYVEILNGNTPLITAHYNTFNITAGGYSMSTFQNATIPLTSFVGDIVRIRVVAQVVGTQKFIAVGDFSLAPKPIMNPAILVNMSINLNQSSQQ